MYFISSEAFGHEKVSYVYDAFYYLFTFLYQNISSWLSGSGISSTTVSPSGCELESLITGT